jgi:hypothetical protein
MVMGLAAAGSGTAGEKHEDKKKGGGETFIQIPEINVTMVLSGHRNGVLSIGINLDIPDPKLRTYAQSLMPRLRDTYVTQLQAYALSLQPGALVDTEYVRSQLQRSTDSLLKKAGARVLLGSIMTN